MNARPPVLSLTADDVQAWRDACVKIEWQKSQLDTELQQLRKKIAAAEVLMGGAEEAPAGAAPVPASPDSPSNWIELVLFALRQADGGRTQRHVLEVGRSTPLADRVKRSPNGVYNAVNRLVGRGKVVKHGELLYLPTLWEAIKAGEVPDNLLEEPNSVSMADDIMRIMADGKPRAPREIMVELSPNAREKLKRNPQYAYTTLSRLVLNKALTRQDGLYSLPQAALPENVTLFTGLRATDGN